MNYEVFRQLGLALLLGLLVGLQRQRTEASLAGIRTFPLITLLGALCAQLAMHYGEWVVVVGLAALAAQFVIGNLVRIKGGDLDPGLTTEMAGLVMFCVGSYLVIGSFAVAVVCGGAVAVLLQWKKPLHEFASRLGEDDVKAIMQFVLITLVVLPVLPNQTYGPLAVFNPFKLWLMVVLIVGISLAGYVTYKLLGQRAGVAIGGVLGGLISSTATTVSYARLTKRVPGREATAAAVIMTASAIVFVRVLVEIATVAPGQFGRMAPPLAAMFVVCGLIAAVSLRQSASLAPAATDLGNPAELKGPLVFAGLYVLVLFAVAAAKQYTGTSGLYVVAVISGLTDMDAITLSTAQLVADERLTADTGRRLILVAGLANFAFKWGVVAVLGARDLRRPVAVRFGCALVAGLLILAFWP